MLAAESRAVVGPATAPRQKSPVSWQEIADGVEPFLNAVSERLLAQVHEFEPEIAEYARYALSAHGKQLRPVLVALSASASGKLNDDHVSVAAIIEMVHLATLVHDDVIDEAQMRRSQPTLAANWGNEISVLLGDCLFAHALKLAADFPTTEICRAVSSATNTVCSGEILQSQQRRNLLMPRSEYFRILAMKTAELFALSCDLGAFLANAPIAQRQALRQFGMKLGLAYQIYDDCLDLFGSEREAGKSLGTDLAKGKLTLPVLIALERCEAAEKAELISILQTWTPAMFSRLLKLLHNCHALKISREVIEENLADARQSLSILPLSKGRVALQNLTEYLGQRVDLLASTP